MSLAGTRRERDMQQRAALSAALAETVDAISMGIDAGSSFVESAMRDVPINRPNPSQSGIGPPDNPDSG